MAKKKKPAISLEGLDDVVFNKDLDIASAQSILKADPVAANAKEDIAENEIVKEPEKEAPKEKAKPEKIAEAKPIQAPVAKAKKEKKQPRGTMPPEDKKRASFNIPKDLHQALRDYSYRNDIDMVTYIFEQLVKPDLKKKGYYPPKERK